MSARPAAEFGRVVPRTPAAAVVRFVSLGALVCSLAVVAAVVVADGASAAPACTRSWDGGAGTTAWTTAENWDGAGGGQLPISTDHVCIAAGSTVVHSSGTTEILSLASDGALTLTGGTLQLTDTVNASHAKTFTQTGGTLHTDGTLTILGHLAWTGGGESGTGRTVIDEDATADFGSALSSITILIGRTFENQGTTTWLDGHITLYGSGPGARTVFENSGILDIRTDWTFGATFDGSGSVYPLLHNTGTIVKTGGTGFTDFTLPFDNDGSLEAAAGTIRLWGGDGPSTGSFSTTEPDALIEFRQGTHDLGTGAGLDGDILLSFATLNIAADVTMPVGSTLTQTGGTLHTDGTLTIGGHLAWTGGEQSGTGRTVIAEAATADLGTEFGSIVLQSGRTFENQGTTTWLDGYITLYGATTGFRTVFENSGQFDVQADRTFGATFTGTQSVYPLLHNTGTIVKTGGAGFTDFTLPFDNDGTLDAAAGTIRLWGGDGPATGTFSTTEPGALIEFRSGTHDLGTGAGLDGDILLSFATLNIADDVSASAGTFTQTGGRLGGDGTLVVLGSLIWTGGVQSDPGATVIAEEATATIGAPFGGGTLRNGRTFLNEGTTTWVDGSILLTGATAGFQTRLENHGLFVLESTGQIYFGIDDNDELEPAFVYNDGTIRRSGNAGTSTVFAPFANDGIVDVQAGTLQIRGLFEQYFAPTRTLSGGAWHVTSTLEFDGADIDTNEAIIILDGPTAKIVDENGASGLRRFAVNGFAGDVTLAGGADLLTPVPFRNDGLLTIGAGSTFTSTGIYEQAGGSTVLETATSTVVATASQVQVTGGSLQGVGSAGPAVLVNGGEVSPGLSSGTIHASGTYEQVAGGVLRVELGGTTPGTFDVLAVTGTAQLGGTLQIDLIDDFVPTPGNAFRILTTSARTGVFASLLGTDLGNGLALTAQYDATGVTLVVSDQSISIDDVSLTEGDTGTVDATLTVTLAEPSSDIVTVEYGTFDDSAQDPDDYAGTSGTLTFQPGQVTKSITVQVAGDVLDEDDETFVVDLFDPTNAPLAKSEGIATILDDDDPPIVSIEATDADVSEGNFGLVGATFTVSVAPASGRTVSVTYTTASGTALSPADFAPKSGVLTFLPGQTTKTIVVDVKGDLAAEPDETFFVDLSVPVNGVLGTARAGGSILDDDLVSIAIDSVSVDEGDTGTTDATFNVTLSAASIETVTVDYTTSNQTATAPDDYLPASGTLTFAPGDTSETVIVQVVGDTLPESTEIFTVELTNAVHAGIVDSSGSATIADGADVSGTPDFQMLISPSIQVLPPGGTATYAVNAIGLFGFDDPVTLSTPDLPTGITATWSVNPLDLPGTSILTLTAEPGISLGERGFTVRGTSGDLVNEITANSTLNFGLIPICYGTIEGYVTDQETGAPIEGALITTSPRVETDAAGHYKILKIELDDFNNPIPDYPVDASKDGYWDDREVGLVVCDFTTRVDLELLKWRPASVRGTIVEGFPDSNDPSLIHPYPQLTPIEDAHVGIDLRASDETGADGTFVLEMAKLNPENEPLTDASLDVRADGYWARPNEFGGGTLTSPFPLGTIQPDEHRTGVIVPLVKKCTGTVGGVVTDAVTHVAIAGATITVSYPITTLTITTDNQGRFTYPGVLLGHNNTPIERTVYAASPGYAQTGAAFPMNACGDAREVEIALPLEPPRVFGTLTGHVYDAETGLALAGASVHTPICALPPGTTCTTTDVNGLYELRNVPLPFLGPAFDVTFFSSRGTAYYLAADSFQMRANETTVHDFRLVPKKYVYLTGVVTDRFTGLPIVGAVGEVSGLEHGAVTDAAGHYLTERIELPPYGEPTAITETFSAAGYWPQHKSKAVAASATPFELNFDLLPICEDATLTGRVINALTQAPIANADVIASSGQGTRTLADGTYRLDHLRVGTDNTPIGVTIQVFADGFKKQTKSITVFCNAVLTLNFGPPDPTGTIVINKVTDPPGSPDLFAFHPTWTSDFDLAGGGSKTFTNLVPGSGYSVSEAVPAGWAQASATCSDGSPVTNINLSGGETVTCTFTNRRLATLLVKKVTDPSPDPTTTSFGFTTGGGLSPSTFSLADGGTMTYDDLTPKSGYSVAETVPAGWSLASATCSDGSPVTNIDLTAGESVTCTFVNHKLPTGTIIVAKTTDPVGSAMSFSFTRSWGAGFSLSDGQTSTNAGLAPGSGYSVAETVPAGWQQTSATCSDGSPVTNIDLAAGETVTCTFVNRQLSTLIVRKTTDPVGSAVSFAFTRSWGAGFALSDGQANTSTGLTPGSGYAVAETVPPGWKQASATCSDGSPVTNIDLAAGETVTCTFVNRKLATLIVRKTTQPSPDPSATSFAFSAGGGLSPATFGLANGDSRTFADVEPAAGYSLAETIPAGWQQVSATCSDGSPVTAIDLGAGETVTCTFINRKLATLIVRKTTQPSPDPTATSFPFSAGGGLSPVSFSLANGGTRTYSDVAPASGYSLSETVPAGWQQISATCSDGSPVTNVNLSPGEIVTCTFVNRRLGLQTGAHTIGFWQNKNGQAIIKGGSVVGGACASATWLRQFKPFQDLGARSSCVQTATYVSGVIKAANASGASMNVMLKAQLLATALSVFFSDPALGGNKIGAPVPIGGVSIDLKSVCIVIDNANGDGTCSGVYEDVSVAFGGAATMKVMDQLVYAAGQSNVGGSTWYGNVKAIQVLAKDLFDAVNNNVAFGP